MSDDTRKQLRKIVSEGQKKRHAIFENAENLARSLMTIKKIIPAIDFVGKVPHGTDFVVTTIEFADSGSIQKKNNKGVRNNHSANRRVLN